MCVCMHRGFVCPSVGRNDCTTFSELCWLWQFQWYLSLKEDRSQHQVSKIMCKRVQCSFCQLPNSLEFHSFLLLNIQTKNGDSEQGQSCDNPPGFEPSACPFFKHAVWWIIRAYINSQRASKRWLSTCNIIEVVKKGGKKERERGTETRIERDDMPQLYTEQEVQEKKRTVCIHTKETGGKAPGKTTLML